MFALLGRPKLRMPRRMGTDGADVSVPTAARAHKSFIAARYGTLKHLGILVITDRGCGRPFFEWGRTPMLGAEKSALGKVEVHAAGTEHAAFSRGRTKR